MLRKQTGGDFRDAGLGRKFPLDLIPEAWPGSRVTAQLDSIKIEKAYSVKQGKRTAPGSCASGHRLHKYGTSQSLTVENYNEKKHRDLCH